jgi:hypothetical protein
LLVAPDPKLVHVELFVDEYHWYVRPVTDDRPESVSAIVAPLLPKAGDATAFPALYETVLHAGITPVPVSDVDVEDTSPPPEMLTVAGYEAAAVGLKAMGTEPDAIAPPV